jgi:hypothetical protein
MARLQADLRLQGIRASSHVVQARAFEAILEVAAHTPAELIVLATRGGMRAGERSVEGSVAVDVIRNGEIPVLIVNGATANPFTQHLAGALRLVLIEDDIRSNATLREYVAAIACALSARVTVLRSLPQTTCGPAQGGQVNSGADDPLVRLRELGIEVGVETGGGNASADAHLGCFARWQRAHLVVTSGHHAVPRPYAEAEALLDILRESRAPVLFVP